MSRARVSTPYPRRARSRSRPPPRVDCGATATKSGQGRASPGSAVVSTLGASSLRTVTVDVATQRVGDRAEIGRPPDDALEYGRLEPRYLCADGELDDRDSWHALHLAECAGGAHGQALGRRLVLAEHKRDRHREAAGMGSRNELLGARLAVRSLGPRRPRHRALVEHTASARQRPGSACERALPDDLGFTHRYGHGSPSCLAIHIPRSVPTRGLRRYGRHCPFGGGTGPHPRRGAPSAVDRADNRARPPQHKRAGPTTDHRRSPRGSNGQRAACGTGAQPH